MHIKTISVSNFRLLQQASVDLDSSTTAVVGRNNSGKTSLTELFRRLLSDTTPSFTLEDFSLSVHEHFWLAYQLTLQTPPPGDAELRAVLPAIEVNISITYETATDLGTLADFVIDLDPACSTALLRITYALDDGGLPELFRDIDSTGSPQSGADSRSAFYRLMKERVPRLYGVHLSAIDPNDHTNTKALEWNRLSALLRGSFITAQRGLDDTTHRDTDVLSRILAALFETASAGAAPQADRATAEQLSTAVKSIERNLDDTFNERLRALLPALSDFGYPGLPDPELRTETTLDVMRLLSGHVRIRYSGANGIHLPESYNGLGSRNLIYILFKLYQFHKEFQAQQPAPAVHLVFIEEPEAHLHPQMQEVFIRQLATVARALIGGDDALPWPVQFVVTTHSSHVANRAPLRSVRYFLTCKQEEAHGTFLRTKIKNLNTGLTGDMAADEPFLHQYMTLTRCDLLFADKVVLIEGASERLMLPRMMEKLDRANSLAPSLASQYISIIEVDGSYAHRFFALLNFLELPALIITDLDSGRTVERRRRKCPVSEGEFTFNSCIKQWYGDNTIRPDALIAKEECEKLVVLRRVAFQVPESAGGACGRSFEDGFILANPSLFGLERAAASEMAQHAFDLALEHSDKKIQFALRYGVESTDWNVPRYIAEGLVWLASATQAAPPSASPTPAASASVG